MVSPGGGGGGGGGFQRLADTKTLKLNISEGRFTGKKTLQFQLKDRLKC